MGIFSGLTDKGIIISRDNGKGSYLECLDDCSRAEVTLQSLNEWSQGASAEGVAYMYVYILTRES
jgi:hypothetical protein